MGEEVHNQINIYVESGSAQQQLDALTSKNKTLTTEVENLRKKQAEADAQRQAGSEQAKKDYISLGEEINKVQKKLEENTAAMDRQSRKVSGDLSPSVRDLEAEIRKLTAAQKILSEEDPGYKHKAEQLKQYRAALDQYKVSSGIVAEKMKEEKEHGEGFMEILKGVAAGFGLITGAEAALEKGIDLIKESVHETLQLELGQKRLETAVKNWKNTSEGAMERFNEKAEDLSKKFGYLYAPEITKVQEKLVTFGRLSEEQINKLVPVIVNFAAQTGKSMDESATSILSAFEGNGRAMKQFGIELKKDEGFAVNYGIVMDQLAAKVDGAAAAFDETNAGKLATYQKNMKLLQEDIGGGLLPVLAEAAKGGVGLITALRMLPEFVDNNRKTIIALAGAYAMYNSALIASKIELGYNTAATLVNTVVERGATLIKWVSVAATGAQTIAYALLTGELELATLATRAYQLAAAAASGGLTFVIGAIVAAGTAWAMYASRLTEAEQAERSIEEVRTSAEKSIASERMHLEELIKVAKDETLSKEKRLKAIKEINAINPEYLSGITLENIKTSEGIQIIDKYIEALNRKAYNQAIEGKKIELYKEKIEIQTKSWQNQMSTMDRVGYATAKAIGDDEGMAMIKQRVIDRLYEENKLIDEQFVLLGKLEKVKVNKEEDGSEGDKKAKELADIQKFFAEARKARKDFDGLDKSSSEEEVNRTQEKIHTLSDKLEEYRHNGILTLGQYYEAKQILEKNDAYKELVDAAKRAEEEAKKRAEQHRKRVEEHKKFQEELYTQEEDARKKNLSADAKELADLADKYLKEEKLVKQFLADGTITKKQAESDIAQIQKNYRIEAQAIQDKQTKEAYAREYEEAQKQAEQLFQGTKAIQLQKLADGEINEREYQNRIREIELAELRSKVSIADQYSAQVKKAKDDEAAFSKQAADKELANQLAHAKEVQAIQDYIRTNKKRTLIAEDAEFAESLDNKLQILADEYAKEYAVHKDNAEEVKSLNARYAAESAKLYEDAWKKSLKEIASDFQKMAGEVMNIVGSIMKIQANSENAQLARDKKANNELIKNYDAQLAHKQISQKKHDKLVEAANEEMAKKDDDLKRRQFERDKKMKIAQIVINTAVGVMNAIATAPNFIMGAIEGALVLAAGIAEGIEVGKEEYVSMGDGGIIGGDKHSDASGGNPVYDGKTGKLMAKVENGEYVAPVDAVKNNPEIISMLGGVGRTRNIKEMLAPASSINTGRAMETIHMANGGFIGLNSAPRPAGTSDSSGIDTSKIESLLSQGNEIHTQSLEMHKQIAAKPIFTLHDLHAAEHIENVMLSKQL